MSRFAKVGLHRPLRLRPGNHRHRWDLAAVSRCLRCESGRCDLPTSAPNVCETRGRESWTSKLCLTCVPDGMVGERGRDQVARNCRHTWRSHDAPPGVRRGKSPARCSHPFGGSGANQLRASVNRIGDAMPRPPSDGCPHKRRAMIPAPRLRGFFWQARECPKFAVLCALSSSRLIPELSPASAGLLIVECKRGSRRRTTPCRSFEIVGTF
jgi:hypothetical protein